MHPTLVQAKRDGKSIFIESQGKSNVVFERREKEKTNDGSIWTVVKDDISLGKEASKRVVCGI
jgi:hypothetical protein